MLTRPEGKRKPIRDRGHRPGYAADMYGLMLLILAVGPTPVELPQGDGGIGFDDLGYSAELGKVLAPAGRTGKLDLIDPKTLAVEAIAGFTDTAPGAKGHGQGSTSASFGSGYLFASDRGAGVVVSIDPKTKKAVSRVSLDSGPDYVRWVEPVKELWVTEPRKKQIEVFALTGNQLSRRTAFTVADGPESLAIDATRGRAYTHTWHGETVAIELKTHKEVARWKNGCEGSRGIALDEAHGWLFVGCEEGKATALDVAHEGKRLGEVATGKGVDIIAYDAKRRHLYVPGGDSSKLSFVAVDEKGALKLLGEADTAEDASCVTSGPSGQVWVCDPKNGRLLLFSDPY